MSFHLSDVLTAGVNGGVAGVNGGVAGVNGLTAGLTSGSDGPAAGVETVESIRAYGDVEGVDYWVCRNPLCGAEYYMHVNGCSYCGALCAALERPQSQQLTAPAEVVVGTNDGAQMAIGVGTWPDGSPVYVTDLPGHNGLVPAPLNPKSDWGYGTREHAILLSPYWQKRFLKYSRDGYGYNGRLVYV